MLETLWRECYQGGRNHRSCQHDQDAREAAEPQDYRKLSQQVLEEAVSSFMFFKAKDPIPSDDALRELSLKQEEMR